MNRYNEIRAISYQKHLVPLMMENSAHVFIESLSSIKANSIMDIACGTGVLTNLLANNFPKARIVGTDISEDMLALARKQSQNTNVAFKLLDAHMLKEVEKFDLITCQYGYMFFEDYTVFLRRAKASLKPHGKLVFSTWDSLEKNNFFYEICSKISQLTQTEFLSALSVPFECNRPEEIVNDVLQCFNNCTYKIVQISLGKMSFEDVVSGFVDGNVLFQDIEQNNPNGFKLLKRICAKHLAEKFSSYWQSEKALAIQFEAS